MEPDTLLIENAAKGLAIFAVIPVVSYALWADYLVRSIDQNTIKNPKYDRNQEIEKVRFGSLLVILFQVSLFLGSSEIRDPYPILCQLGFVIAVLLQLYSQSHTEKKIRVQEKKSDDLFKLALRVSFFWIVGGGAYGAILIAIIRFAAFFAERIHATPFLGTAIVLLGGGLGVISGLALNFALSPFYLKSLLGTELLPDESLRKRLGRCFTQAGLNVPQFLTFDFSFIQIATLITAGFQMGRGKFQSSVFIPMNIIRALDPQELEALVSTQASHIALKHLRKRFLYSLFLILATTIIAIVSVVIGQILSSHQVAITIILPTVALLSFFIAFTLLNNQSKKHDFEADQYSIDRLNINPEHLVRALKKLSPEIAQDTMPTDFDLMDNEKRIHLIEKHRRDQPSDEKKAG